MSEVWSREELEAAVTAYLAMLNEWRSGYKPVKKDYYEKLATRFNRSAKAFEYRMQNISYVLAQMNRDWLPGLKPAKNVGTHTAAHIESIIIALTAASDQQTSVRSEEELQEKRGRYKNTPHGIKKPVSKAIEITQYARDPAVKAWVLSAAKDCCELCTAPAPFEDADGTPFLEVHHVRRLADGGSDTVSNTVALCPNCHRALHYSRDAKALAAVLYSQIQRLIPE